eukprot:Em0003g477a
MKRVILRKRLYVSSLAVALLVQMAAAVQNVYTFNPPRNKTDDLFVIGVLLPIHETFNGSCGQIDRSIVQYVEAISYVIQRINSRQAYLSGVKLGFEIYDSCGTVNIALQQTLRLLTPKNGNGVSVVIGEAISSVTIQVANLLQLFHVPLISFASTTPSLSDKTQYGYFARTCPSDSYQARALADIVNHFNWSYVVAINSGDIYGQAGIKGFMNNFQNVTLNRCVAGDSIEIPYPCQRSGVRLRCCSTVEGLLDAVQRRRERDHSFATKQFLWVGSAAWTTSLDPKRYEIARNVIGAIPEAVNTAGFDEYFQRLHISNHTDNPWFAEYWEDYFKCSLNGTNPALPICNASNQRISRTNGYIPDAHVPNSIDAVYAIAHAVRQIQQSVCNGSGLCNATRSSETTDVSTVDGRLLLLNILKVNFTSESDNDFSFDSNGDPTNTIFTVQYVHNGQMNTLGKWDRIKPSLISCGVRRFAVGFGFSSCFSPVLVRTVRIHRIFNRKASATSLRKVPGNFNEAKFINLTTYSLLIIWIAFIPIYYGTLSLGPTFQSSSLIMGTVLSASVILGCLVVPKMYIIIRTKLKENQERGKAHVAAQSVLRMDNMTIRKKTNVHLQPKSVDKAIQQETQTCHACTQTDN